MPRQSYVAEAGKPFQIDGSASSDPDGDELNYMWTLSGLGSPIDLSTKMSDFVTIDTPGNDLVLTLLVQDPGGLTNQDIVVINVEPGNRPPVAKIVTPSNGGAYSEGKEVTFDGMASSDPDNDILSYNWDLGEAGGPTYTASKQSRFSLDLEEGDYSVTLTVEDPDGESNSKSHSLSVTNCHYHHCHSKNLNATHYHRTCYQFLSIRMTVLLDKLYHHNRRCNIRSRQDPSGLFL